MVSAFVSRSSGPGSSPGRGHCFVFLGKTLNSHSASLHPGGERHWAAFNGRDIMIFLRLSLPLTLLSCCFVFNSHIFGDGASASLS